MKSNKEKYNEIIRKRSDLHQLTDEELAALKNILLETYLKLAEVCEKHNLVYMLCGGSCLGAVRHEGFIPWDDDLDVVMPRPDYEQLKKIFKEEFGDQYFLEAPNYEGTTTNRFGKLHVKGTRFVEVGMPEDAYSTIKIDIFTLDNIPDNRIRKYIKGIHCTALMYIASKVSYYERSKSGVIGRLFSFRTASHWFDAVDRAFIYRPDEKTAFVGIPAGRKHYFGEVYPRSDMLPVSKGVFEGKTVNLPGIPDTYLKTMYGDYMQLPPEEKRERHYIEAISF